MSPEERRQFHLKHVTHWWIYSVIERIANGVVTPSDRESQFVRDGKAIIQLDLSGISREVREKLRAAGLETLSENETKLTGRISIEKLAGLADMEEVKYILPVIL
jgi:hypothetical protein